ncbi:carotenoid oxygenase family protein [Cupriavidus basilensis]
MFHVMNAWEAGNKIIADVMQYESAPCSIPAPMASVRACAAGPSTWPASPTVSRASTWTTCRGIPALRRTLLHAALSPRLLRVPPAREQRARGSYDGLAHIDLRSGKRAVHVLPQGDAISEPVFVPRVRPDSAEGDGWLLATVYRGAQARSDLVVLDAGAVADGPVATVQLSHRVPFGFHGNWHGAD